MFLSQLLKIFVSYKKKVHPLLIYQFRLTSLLVSQDYNLMIENLAPNRPTSENKTLIVIYYSKPWQQYLGINLRQLHAVAKKCKMLQHRRTIRHVVKVVCGFIVLRNQTPQLQVWALRHKAFKITFAVVNFSSYLTVLM